MIVVEQNKFIPYDQIPKASYRVVSYPSLFGGEILSQISAHLKKHPRKVTKSLMVGLALLTNKMFEYREKKHYHPGTAACIMLTKGKLIFTNNTNKETRTVKGKKGTVFILGAMFREKWSYKAPQNIICLIERNPLSYIYLSIEQRLKYAKLIHRALKKYKKLPLWEQCPQQHMNLVKLLGTGSYANVYTGETNGMKFALKMSKLKPEALSHPYSNYVSSWFEVFILKKILRPLLYNNICPNLPLLFNSFVCKDCQLFIDEEEVRTPCVITTVELADGDLKHYLKDYKPNKQEIYSALFQVMAALHAIQISGQIMNYDVKKENILYYNVEPGGYWHYQIHGFDFYVPNYGKLFILNDYGISRPMSPLFPLYREPKAQTFRLGSRYAVVRNGIFEPFNTTNQVDAEGDLVAPVSVSWDGDDQISVGAQYRIYRPTGEVIPLHTELDRDLRLYLEDNDVSTDSTSYDFFLFPEIIPPFEFYNDTQDAIRMFIGGKRSTQRGYHRRYDAIPLKVVHHLKKYLGPGDSMKDGQFSTNPAQVLAGYFIEQFFAQRYRSNDDLGEKLASYIMS